VDSEVVDGVVVEYKVLPESVGEVGLGAEDLKTDLRFQCIVTLRIRWGIQASRMAKEPPFMMGGAPWVYHMIVQCCDTV